MAFAKLYGDDNDQVLVMIDSGDEGPEIRFFFQPEQLGVCQTAMTFPDTEDGWNKTEQLFDQMDEANARKIVDKLKKNIVELSDG